MKIIISLLTSALLTSLAIAQEESASPAESTPSTTTEEKASATVETTPEATVAPAAEKKAESATAATSAPATGGQKKEAATTAKPATAAKPAAAAPAGSKVMGKNISVKDMENAWEASVAKHDYATVEGFVAADFAGVSSKNKFVGRSDVLADAKRDNDTYKSAKNEKLNVKMYGNNVAVVTGRAREVGNSKDGKAFDRTFLFTDTWMMRGGKWQCIASQISKIKG
jgi:cytoskeletal protein RodZ